MSLIGTLLLAAAAFDPASLVEAERAFSRLCAEKGMKEAFMANLAPDGILFRPGPVEGIAWMRDRPAPAGLLTWEPARWEVSAAGDLGYTTGPYQFRAKGKDDPEVRHGHYVTVWRKQADGSWKVAIDIGVSHAAGVPPVATARARSAKPAGGEPADLLARDRAFAETARARGAAAAFEAFLSDDAVVFRMDEPPHDRREAASSRSEPTAWQPRRAEASRSGDLGFSYGTADGAPALNYVRIWRRDGEGFRIVIDVTNPVPRPQ